MNENKLMTALASAVAPLAAFYVQTERQRPIQPAPSGDVKAAGDVHVAEGEMKTEGESWSQVDGRDVKAQDGADDALFKAAAAKAVYEVDEILQAWRKTGDFRVRSPESKSDYVRGQGDVGSRYPAPTLATVAELLYAFGQFGDGSGQDRQTRRAELAVEEKRLDVQRLELELRLAKVKAGQKDDPPVQQKLMMLSAPPTESTWGTGDSGQSNSGSGAQVAAPPTQAPATVDEGSPRAVLRRLIDCLVSALCDLAWCLLDLFCKDGKFNWDAAEDPGFRDDLRDCLGTFLCSVLRCIPEALCPPRKPECPQPISQDCNFAVEG